MEAVSINDQDSLVSCAEKSLTILAWLRMAATALRQALKTRMLWTIFRNEWLRHPLPVLPPPDVMNGKPILLEQRAGSIRPPHARSVCVVTASVIARTEVDLVDLPRRIFGICALIPAGADAVPVFCSGAAAVLSARIISIPSEELYTFTSLEVIVYSKLSGSRQSSRPAIVSACGYIRNSTAGPLAPGSIASRAKL